MGTLSSAAAILPAFAPITRACRPSASTRGSATAQLAGQAHGLECIHGRIGDAAGPYNLWRRCADGARPTPDVATALARLAGFAFVGLTNEYARSVCLFHLMHGGRCRAAEFHNGNPTWQHALPHGAAAAVDADDAYDEELYAAARRRFWSDVRRFGASDETCSRICTDAWARHEPAPASSTRGTRATSADMREQELPLLAHSPPAVDVLSSAPAR